MPFDRNGKYVAKPAGWWHKTPNTATPQTPGQPAPWQMAAQPGGYGGSAGGGYGGGGAGMDQFLQQLLGFSQNQPAAAGYGGPQMPGGLMLPGLGAPPQLEPNAPLTLPGGGVGGASVGYGPTITPPTLPTPEPLQMPGQLTTPTLNNPTLMPPGNLNLPALNPGVSLGELAGATERYHPTDPQSLFGPAPTATPINSNFSSMFGGSGQQGPPGAAGASPGPMDIRTGIQAAGVPQAPQAQAMGGVEGMVGPAAAAMAANQSSQMPGVNTGLGVQHAQNAAQYLQNLQNAQSQAGLNWGQTGLQRQNMLQNAQLGQSSNLLSFLNGMM